MMHFCYDTSLHHLKPYSKDVPEKHKASSSYMPFMISEITAINIPYI